MIEDGGESNAHYTELFEATPQLFYQRLLSLNHGLVLKATTQRFRRNRVFEWNEPLFTKNLCTMAAIDELVQHKFHLGVDLIRLYESFGDRPFGQPQFTELFRTRLRGAMRRHPAGEKKAEVVVASPQFQSFLLHRMGTLIQLRLVERIPTFGEERFRLTSRGFEAGLYLDLFLHNIWFQGKVPHCAHCQRSP